MRGPWARALGAQRGRRRHSFPRNVYVLQTDHKRANKSTDHHRRQRGEKERKGGTPGYPRARPCWPWSSHPCGWAVTVLRGSPLTPSRASRARGASGSLGKCRVRIGSSGLRCSHWTGSGDRTQRAPCQPDPVGCPLAPPTSNTGWGSGGLRGARSRCRDLRERNANQSTFVWETLCSPCMCGVDGQLASGWGFVTAWAARTEATGHTSARSRCAPPTPASFHSWVSDGCTQCRVSRGAVQRRLVRTQWPSSPSYIAEERPGCGGPAVHGP